MQYSQIMNEERIIIFTRFPVAGLAKTRLIPALGAESAAEFQRKMTEFILEQARKTGKSIEIHFVDGDSSQMRDWLGDDCLYVQQKGEDLGARMNHAFVQGFNKGASKIILIGCDCPDNRKDNILKAFQLLSETSCVLGPALDGGYYLIGLSHPQPELFQGITWGSDQVLAQTRAKRDDYRLLDFLRDVDEPQDIPPLISVIIPVLNEADNIQSCLEGIEQGFHVETILVDGGSQDQTLEIAQTKGVRVLTGALGRARQMNHGANHASGEILLFLHGDSLLPKDWDYQIRQMMKRENIVLGAFRFALSEKIAGMRWVEFWTNIRSRFFNRPYGDQGLFLKKETFNHLGGYLDIPLLEDLYLVKKAKKIGQIGHLKVSILTSARRWVKHGVIKTTLINQVILVMAALGKDLEKLKSSYRSGDGPLKIIWRALKD